MYAPKMKGLCLRYLGDPETTKDIVQDGFIKVFSNIKQFDGKGSFDGWIKRIFINTCISHLRKNNRKNRHLDVEEFNESGFHENEIHSTEKMVDLSKSNVDLVLSTDLSEEEMMNVLKKIPENFRTVFNLFCIEKLKHEKIAEILNIDINTSRTRLLRARALIQKELYGICLEKLKQYQHE